MSPKNIDRQLSALTPTCIHKSQKFRQNKLLFGTGGISFVVSINRRFRKMGDLFHPYWYLEPSADKVLMINGAPARLEKMPCDHSGFLVLLVKSYLKNV